MRHRYPELMGKVLGIFIRTLSTHLAHQAGFKKKEAHTEAVTLIPRFGSALNLNIHFHMLFLDGVFVQDGAGGFAFHGTKAPTVAQLTELLHTISQLVASLLERRGLLERDDGNSYLTLEGLDEDPVQDIHTHSVTYRIAMGPHSVGAKLPRPAHAPDLHPCRPGVHFANHPGQN